MSEQVNGLSRRAFVGGAALFGAAMVMNPGHAFAVSAAEKQAEADAVRNQLVSLQADLEQAASAYYAALEEQEAAEASMEAEQVKIDAANKRIAELQDRLGSRVSSMYRTGPTGFLDFVLGATSFEEFTQNWDLLGQMNENDADLVEQSRTEREQLQASKEEYARQADIAAAKAAEAADAKALADARVAEATELISSLDEEARELLEQEQAAAAIAAAAAAQQEQERAAASVGNGGGSSNGGGSYTNDTPYYPAPVYTNTGSAGDNSAVVSYALSRIGCPYVWAAEGPSTFDCSGLVRWAYLQIGISLPHYTESLYAVAVNRVPVSEARPGDVLYRPGHVGIAVDYGGVPYVHAPTFGAYVRDTDALSWSGFTCALQF